MFRAVALLPSTSDSEPQAAAQPSPAQVRLAHILWPCLTPSCWGSMQTAAMPVVSVSEAHSLHTWLLFLIVVQRPKWVPRQLAFDAAQAAADQAAQETEQQTQEDTSSDYTGPVDWKGATCNCGSVLHLHCGKLHKLSLCKRAQKPIANYSIFSKP